MALQEKETRPAVMGQAVRLALVTVLEAEVDAFVGALRYERTSERRDQRNGYDSRDRETTVGRSEEGAVPRPRRGDKTQLVERDQRRRAELDAAISERFIVG